MAAIEKKENIFRRLLKRKKLLIILAVLIVGGYFLYGYFTGNEDYETAEVKRGTVAKN